MSHAIVIVAGKLAQDPVTRYTNNGNAVCEFSIPVHRKYKDANGESKDETTWWNITAWGKQAESVGKYLAKGGLVFIEGRMKPDPQTGNPIVFQRSDGTYGAKYEVTAETVRFLGDKPTEKITTDEVDPEQMPF